MKNPIVRVVAFLDRQIVDILKLLDHMNYKINTLKEEKNLFPIYHKLELH